MDKFKSKFEEEMHPKVMELLTSDLGFPVSAIQREVRATNLSFEEKNYISDYAISVYGEARIYVEVKGGITHPDFFNGKKISSTLKDKPIYFILIVGEHAPRYWKITDNLEEIKSPPTFSDLLDEVPTIHNNVLNFLLEKREENKELRFTLRSRNNNGRLDKGYWFLGNKDYVAFSFWTGKDYKNKTSNIYFEVTTKGEVILRISVKDSEKKKEALKDLTGMLDLKTNKSENVYWKYYDRNASKNYIELLDKFLSTDKRIIDLFIKNINHADLGFIPENEFESNYVFLKPYIEKINKLKTEKQQEEKVEVIAYPPTIALEKLDLINIGQFKKVSLDLSKKTTCILGSNGIGKTTLLRSILIALIGFGIDEDNLLDVDSDSLHHLLSVENTNKDGDIIYSDFGRIKLNYSIDNKIHANNISIQKNSSGVPVFSNEDSENGEPTFNALDGIYFKSLVIAYSQIITKGKKEKNHDYKPNYKEVTDFIYNKGNDRFGELANWIIKSNGEIANREKENQSAAQLKEALALIFELVSEITENKISLASTEGLKNQLWVQLENQPPILFSLLSQGYKRVISWVGHMIRRMYESYEELDLPLQNAPALIIIDEIDTYLHPSWQKNILNVITKKFPNVRTVVTTHSPLVVTHLEEYENCNVLLVTPYGIKSLEHFYGTQISSAFNIMMDVKERHPKVQKLIDDIFMLLEENPSKALIAKTKDEIQSLKKIRGSHDPVISELENMFNFWSTYEN